MIFAFDVFYTPTHAKSVRIGFEQWNDPQTSDVLVKYIPETAEYESGEFYKRELPCIVPLLADIDLTNTQCIVVDGYVVLNDEGKLGLGGYLYEYLDKKIPIIGVAKRSFAQNAKLVRQICRGQSKNPLFISAIGIDIVQAAQHIMDMHGNYRIPTLLKYLDSLTKLP